MQFLATALSILSLSSAALGCTRHTVTFRSAEPACFAGQLKYHNACNTIKSTISDFSIANHNIYGKDFTNRFTGCDSCDKDEPRCYCSVTAWRFHEWEKTDNTYALGDWERVSDWTPIDSKTVDC